MPNKRNYCVQEEKRPKGGKEEAQNKTPCATAWCFSVQWWRAKEGQPGARGEALSSSWRRRKRRAAPPHGVLSIGHSIKQALHCLPNVTIPDIFSLLKSFALEYTWPGCKNQVRSSSIVIKVIIIFFIFVFFKSTHAECEKRAQPLRNPENSATLGYEQ